MMKMRILCSEEPGAVNPDGIPVGLEVRTCVYGGAVEIRAASRVIDSASGRIHL